LSKTENDEVDLKDPMLDDDAGLTQAIISVSEFPPRKQDIERTSTLFSYANCFYLNYL
jgi:hypothetical protein